MKTCRVCGKQFQSNVNNKTICNNCREKLTKRYDELKKGGSNNPERCIICGKKIEPHGSKKKHYTCSPECAYLMKFIASWKYQQRKKEREKMTVKIPVIKRLDRNIAAAKEAGLSYGIYMAKKRGQL
jgi:predicted nucleic acid-binding Zn ribbon protein